MMAETGHKFLTQSVILVGFRRLQDLLVKVPRIQQGKSLKNSENRFSVRCLNSP